VLSGHTLEGQIEAICQGSISIAVRVLLIHLETEYFAGAEAMLIYFLEELVSVRCETVVAVSKDSKLARLIPDPVEKVQIHDSRSFSIGRLGQQLTELVRHHIANPFDIIHGWAARDWELTSLVGWRIRRPTVGTLHDHPRAGFFSLKRQRLMRWCARHGLQKIVCVSQAVRTACLRAGYHANKLVLIHNGLPEFNSENSNDHLSSTFHLGFLGVFSERKGMKSLFAILKEFAKTTDLAWEISLAGMPQDSESRRLIEEIRRQHGMEPWWKRVRWCGWIERPHEFLRSLDLLMAPSTDFDPFPTVLLEAGLAGIPVLAAKVGGVTEIILDGDTGWLYEPDNRSQAAQILARLAADRSQCRIAGQKARLRVIQEFSISKMVANYRSIYSSLSSHV
jgi:glycosyltransferase involved in cell wall biosynthesis